MEPLQQWICDVCWGIIECPEHGYVVWKSDDQDRNYDIKIIHQVRCDREDHPCSEPLNTFLGVKGLSYLLSYLSIGPIKRYLGQTGAPEFRDFDEYVDFFRRVQIPHYEGARRNFGNADVLGLFDDANEFSPYVPEALWEIENMQE